VIDTLPVTTSSKITQVHLKHRSNRSPYDVARSVVADYLYDWGLTDPEVIATESRRIVYKAAGEVSSSSIDVNLPHFEQQMCEMSIRMTILEVEQSISKFEQRDSNAALNSDSLLDIPADMDHRDRGPARLLVKLEETVAPVVPLPVHRDMLPQPKTRLLKMFRPAYWQVVLKKLMKHLPISE
jgi:hypothetical protein